MKVILKENIENLGKKGDIVDVAPGYGRNYLLPKKMALAVTPTNMKMIEIEQKALQKRYEKDAASYQDVIDKLNQISLSFTRKAGEKDSIFGSVSASDIKEALDKQGLEIEKKKIMLEEPIKRLGNYSITIKIYHDEKAEVKVEVVKEGEGEAPKKKSPEAEEKKTVEKKEAEKETEKAGKDKKEVKEKKEVKKEDKKEEKKAEKKGKKESVKIPPEKEKDKEKIQHAPAEKGDRIKKEAKKDQGKKMKEEKKPKTAKSEPKKKS